jgi:hypothetical protein
MYIAYSSYIQVQVFAVAAACTNGVNRIDLMGICTNGVNRETRPVKQNGSNGMATPPHLSRVQGHDFSSQKNRAFIRRVNYGS